MYLFVVVLLFGRILMIVVCGFFCSPFADATTRTDDELSLQDHSDLYVLDFSKQSFGSCYDI